MKIENIWVGIIICFSFLNYNFEKDTAILDKRQEENSKIIGEIETKDMELAREDCSQGYFTFCDGGYDDYFRNYPAFVQLNFENFIQSYDSSIFLFAPPNILDTLRSRNEKFSLPWDMDDIFEKNLSKSNSIKFYTSNIYKKRVRRVSKQNKLTINFDGYFSYYLYSIRFQSVYGGKRIMLIPNTCASKSDNRIMKEKECDIYYIVDIINVLPITSVPKYRESARSKDL
jgi:hypothetical protein